MPLRKDTTWTVFHMNRAERHDGWSTANVLGTEIAFTFWPADVQPIERTVPFSPLALAFSGNDGYHGNGLDDRDIFDLRTETWT